MPIASLQSLADRHVLPVLDWLAHNAYLAPGSHRLLTASGLMGGLLIGRGVTDVLVGMDRHGVVTEPWQLPAPLRPFHGVFRYNPHDDSPQARWQAVLEHLAPVLVGGMGAMLGSSLYFRTLHPGTAKLTRELSGGAQGLYLQEADYLASMVHSKHFNRLAGVDFMLGSASGAHVLPNPLGTMTSAIRFQLGAGRKPGIWGLRKLTGNRGANSLNLYHSLCDMMSWAENNIAHYGGSHWYHDNQALISKTRNALQAFGEISPSQQEAFAAYMVERVHQLEAIAKQVQAEHGDVMGTALLEHLKQDASFTHALRDAFWAGGLEDEFIRLGLVDPKHPERSGLLIGDNGILSHVGKWMGGSHEITEISRQWEDAVKSRHGFSAPQHAPLKPQVASSLLDKPMIIGGGAALGGIGLAAYLNGASPAPSQPAIDTRGMARHEAARRVHASEPKATGINGTPLDAMSWLSNVLVEAPSLHRFVNAISLSTALYGGMQIANSLAGRGLRGNILRADQVMFPSLYQKLDYVWQSGKSADRWKYVAHQLLPVSFGAVGTYASSQLFFRPRSAEAAKAEYLDDYTDKVALDESRGYATALGLTSIFNTGTGFHMIPGLSYSSNLQNHYLMASGLQIATPGLGAIWSGNASHYPYHVKRMLNVMIEYATHNPDEFPKQFEAMAHAVLSKLYPMLDSNAMREKEDAFIDVLYAVRDRYWQAGGVPSAQQEACKDALNQAFHGEGLERTLRSIGLDPAHAALDHNGMSGWIAKRLGTADAVANDVSEYQAKLARRQPTSHIHPPQRHAWVQSPPEIGSKR